MPNSLDEPVDDRVEVRTGGGVAEVEVVAVVLDDALAVALQEGLVGAARRAIGLRTPITSGSSQSPGVMPARADAVDDLAEAAREPGRRRLPLADAVPPVSAVVVPAGVDAEDLRARVGGRVDQRQQLLGGRVAVQRVHVVVEDDAASRALSGCARRVARR